MDISLPDEVLHQIFTVVNTTHSILGLLQVCTIWRDSIFYCTRQLNLHSDTISSDAVRQFTRLRLMTSGTIRMRYPCPLPPVALRNVNLNFCTTQDLHTYIMRQYPLAQHILTVGPKKVPTMVTRLYGGTLTTNVRDPQAILTIIRKYSIYQVNYVIKKSQILDAENNAHIREMLNWIVEYNKGSYRGTICKREDSAIPRAIAIEDPSDKHSLRDASKDKNGLAIFTEWWDTAPPPGAER